MWCTAPKSYPKPYNLGLQFSVQPGFLSGKPWTVTLVTDRHLKVVARIVFGGQEEQMTFHSMSSTAANDGSLDAAIGGTLGCI